MKEKKIKAPKTIAEEVESSIKQMAVKTAVKAWSFQARGKYYKVIQCFFPRRGEAVFVHTADKKGQTLNQTPLHTIWNSTDYMDGVNWLISKLQSEEPTEEVANTEV
jgi:hypothetical protein